MLILRLSLFCMFLLQTQMINAVITPKEAIDKLVKGNERFMGDQLICPDRTSDRRLSLQQKQKPFAVILGCSDSRIPPEIVFDQGLGDLFIVRVAGNVAGDVELDSIKYSVFVNGSSLIVVLGHESCGAIDAFITHKADGVPAVADLIKTALSGTKSNTLEEAIINNVKYQVNLLKKSEAFADLIKQGKLDIIGAYYHFVTGKVDILN